MTNKTILLMTNEERIKDIEKKIRGVKGIFNITQFELNVMATLKKQHHGSDKQERILSKIEIKVFGYSKSRMESRRGIGNLAKKVAGNV